MIDVFWQLPKQVKFHFVEIDRNAQNFLCTDTENLYSLNSTLSLNKIYTTYILWEALKIASLSVLFEYIYHKFQSNAWLLFFSDSTENNLLPYHHISYYASFYCTLFLCSLGCTESHKSYTTPHILQLFWNQELDKDILLEAGYLPCTINCIKISLEYFLCKYYVLYFSYSCLNTCFDYFSFFCLACLLCQLLVEGEVSDFYIENYSKLQSLVAISLSNFDSKIHAHIENKSWNFLQE